jgi:hypothetical protein
MATRRGSGAISAQSSTMEGRPNFKTTHKSRDHCRWSSCYSQRMTMPLTLTSAVVRGDSGDSRVKSFRQSPGLVHGYVSDRGMHCKMR